MVNAPLVKGRYNKFFKRRLQRSRPQATLERPDIYLITSARDSIVRNVR